VDGTSVPEHAVFDTCYEYKCIFGLNVDSMVTVYHKPAASQMDCQAYRDMFEILVD
jgi:hypothetical protein